MPYLEYSAAGDVDDTRTHEGLCFAVLLVDMFRFRLSDIIFCALSLHIPCIVLR